MLTKKIPTILAILLLIAVGVGLLVWQRNQSGVVSSEITPSGVKITNVSDNKFSVSWTTTAPTSGAIEYGEVGAKLEARAQDDRGSDHVGFTHHVTVSGLQPNTRYAFRIISSPAERRFDNNGSVYTVNTGSTLSDIPAARSLYGEVSGGSEDVVVYVTLPNAQAASTTLKASGSYTIPLSIIRSADLKSFVSYDPAATVISLLVDGGESKSKVTVSTTTIAPVPKIILGQNADFRTTAPQIAEVAPTEVVSTEPSPSPTLTPNPLAIFNVEPLAEPEINAVTNPSYTLTNPAVEGEVLSTTRPEFRGTGAANAEIGIQITGAKEVTDTIRIGSSGSWTWTPVIALPTGKHKITISYKDKDGKPQTIARNFSVTTASATSEPAFVATPSASATGNAVSPTPRAAIPATDSGVPVTGVMAPTLLTLALGFAIMVVGAFLIVL